MQRFHRLLVSFVAAALLLPNFFVGADSPQILSISAGDPDDADRSYGVADIITISLAAQTATGGLSFRFIANTMASNGQGIVLDKAGVDALFHFSASLGADYSAQWTQLSILQQLVLTVIDPTGADTARLQAFDFNVSCVAGAVVLMGATTADSACSSVHVPAGPTTTVNWGLGRPQITSVVASSPSPHLLLGPGDVLTISFSAPVDTDAVDAQLGLTPANGTAYVRRPPTAHAAHPRSAASAHNARRPRRPPRLPAARHCPRRRAPQKSCSATARLRRALSPLSLCV
jgi:hypothetical protein